MPKVEYPVVKSLKELNALLHPEQQTLKLDQQDVEVAFQGDNLPWAGQFERLTNTLNQVKDPQ